jgi:hypothetical protein
LKALEIIPKMAFMKLLQKCATSLSKTSKKLPNSIGNFFKKLLKVASKKLFS